MWSKKMNKYLESSIYINWENGAIKSLASDLASQSCSQDELAKISFEWVRNNIKHSSDFQQNPVTCKASDVLKYKTGYCYAKSHLLAALFRANKIEAGLCYQRLSLIGKGAPYCLHGLNAVKLENGSWYRIDPRGNKKGIDAQFKPPIEKLAFSIESNSEADFPEIWPSPLPQVTEVLEKFPTWKEVYENLPDIELF